MRLAASGARVLLVLVPQFLGITNTNAVVPLLDRARDKVVINHDGVPRTAMVVAPGITMGHRNVQPHVSINEV